MLSAKFSCDAPDEFLVDLLVSKTVFFPPGPSVCAKELSFSDDFLLLGGAMREKKSALFRSPGQLDRCKKRKPSFLSFSFLFFFTS